MDVINPVLAQKVGAAPVVDADEGKGAISPMRIVRRAMARAADKSVGLSVSVLGIAQEDQSAEELIENAPEDWIVLGLRDGNEAGLTGLFLIDPALRSALVEMQTMGYLLAATTDQRKVTGTDATLTVPFAMTLLSELSDLDFGAGDVRTSGYDIGPLEDIRTAGLVLSQGNYRHWRITIQMGGTDSQGELLLAVRLPIEEPIETTEKDVDWSAAFQKSLSEAPTEMEAVLATLKMPISSVEGFDVGQVLPLAGTTVGSVTLTGPSGEPVAQARLGQVAGKRAVRIQDHTLEMQDATPAAAPTQSDSNLIDG